MYKLDLTPSEHCNHISISGDLSIYTVADIYNELSLDFLSNKNININLENITDFDTAGAQLLVLLTNKVQQSGHSCELNNINQAIKDYFNLFQLTQLFQLTETG